MQRNMSGFKFTYTSVCPATRHLPLILLQPWQARFVGGNSDFFWDSAASEYPNHISYQRIKPWAGRPHWFGRSSPLLNNFCQIIWSRCLSTQVSYRDDLLQGHFVCGLFVTRTLHLKKTPQIKQNRGQNKTVWLFYQRTDRKISGEHFNFNEFSFMGSSDSTVIYHLNVNDISLSLHLISMNTVGRTVKHSTLL